MVATQTTAARLRAETPSHFGVQARPTETATATVNGLARRFFGVSLYRNSVFLILNSVVPAVTGFLFWTLATRLYPTEAIGVASAVISAMTLLMFVSTLGLDFALIRFLPQAGAGAGRIVMTSFTVSGLAGAGLALAFVAMARFWPSLAAITGDPVFAVTFVGATAVFSVYSLAHHVFIASRRSGYALSQTIVFSTVRFLPLVALAGVTAASGIFVAWGIGLAGAMALGLVFLLPRLRIEGLGAASVQPRVIRPMLSYSFANFTANLLWMSPSLLLPLLVISVLGAEATARFAIGWAVASIILMIPAGVSLSLFAEGSHDETRLRAEASRGAGLMFPLVALTIAAVWVAGRDVLRVFGTEYAAGSTQLLRLLAISAAPACLNYLYVSVNRVRKRMAGVIILSGFIAAITLTLGYFLLRRNGVEGVGLAYLIAQTLPFPFVAISLVRSLGTSETATTEPEYGDFIEGARVSVANHEQHLGRYRFAGRLVPSTTLRTGQGERCLDIGCGTGYGTAYLSRGAREVTGGDISEEAISLARKHHRQNGGSANSQDTIIKSAFLLPRATAVFGGEEQQAVSPTPIAGCPSLSFRTLDATALPFTDGSFDFITAFEVIEHMAEGERLLAEVHRVLQSGGVLVLSTPNRSAGPLLFRTSWRHHLHEYHPRELTQMVERYFGACEVYGQDYITSRQLLARRLRQTAGRLLDVMGLRPVSQRLGRLIFRHNRLVEFHSGDFEAADARGGEVRPLTSGLTPTTIVITARKQ